MIKNASAANRMLVAPKQSGRKICGRVIVTSFFCLALAATASCTTFAVPAFCAAAEDAYSEIKTGLRDYRHGDFENALGHLNAALPTEYNNPNLHYHLANCYVHMHDKDDAVCEYRIAYALDSNGKIGNYSKMCLLLFGIDAEGKVIVAAKGDKKKSNDEAEQEKLIVSTINAAEATLDNHVRTYHHPKGPPKPLVEGAPAQVSGDGDAGNKSDPARGSSKGNSTMEKASSAGKAQPPATSSPANSVAPASAQASAKGAQSGSPTNVRPALTAPPKKKSFFESLFGGGK